MAVSSVSPMDMPGEDGPNDKISLAPEDNSTRSAKGLSTWLAAVFIVGQMAGSGVLALPKAMSNAGWTGIFVLVYCCFNALYCGMCLGRSWMILEERWDEYKSKSRFPYPSIAYRAVGPKMRYFVSFCLDFTLLGVATVFILLSSQTLASVCDELGIPMCYWILILAAILCPLMWLGSPEDFWPVAVGAVETTLLATLLLIGAVIADKDSNPAAKFDNPTFGSFSLAFATIQFAFGGAALFPTFQNDMKDRSQFPKSASIGFTVLLLLYSPVAISGYWIYGSKVEDNVIMSLTNQTSSLTVCIQVLIAVHLVFAFLIVVNTPAQETEEFLGIPTKFGWKRVVVRTAIMLVIVFIANTIPRFGKILDLIGGSTNTLTTFVFPPWFYIKLCSERNPDWPERIKLFLPNALQLSLIRLLSSFIMLLSIAISLPRRINLPEKIYLMQVIILGVIGGCVSTYFAMESIISDSAFIPPCYVNITAASSQ